MKITCKRLIPALFALGALATPNAYAATVDVSSITFDTMDFNVTVDSYPLTYSLTSPPVTLDLVNGTTFSVSENDLCLAQCDTVTVTLGAFTATADDQTATVITTPTSLEVDLLIDIGSGYYPLGVELVLLPLTIPYDTLDNTFVLDWSTSAVLLGKTIDVDLLFEGSIEPVPVPAAVWLFGSGLLGLVGIARRKKLN